MNAKYCLWNLFSVVYTESDAFVTCAPNHVLVRESAILEYKCCCVPEFSVCFFSHEAITFGDEDKNRTSDQPVKNSELWPSV